MRAVAGTFAVLVVVGLVGGRKALATCDSVPGTGYCGDGIAGDCCKEGTCADWLPWCGENVCGDNLCCGVPGEIVTASQEAYCCSGNYTSAPPSGNVKCLGLPSGEGNYCWTSIECDSKYCYGAIPHEEEGICECVDIGSPCFATDGCCTGYCLDGVCSENSCNDVGGTCQTTSDCCSSYCDVAAGICKSTCQGTVGGSCDTGTYPGCCETMACNASNECETCVPLNNNPSLVTCTTALDCCNQGGNPAECNTSGVCVAGLNGTGTNTCDTYTECEGDSYWSCYDGVCQGAPLGDPCGQDIDCASGICIDDTCCGGSGQACNSGQCCGISTCSEETNGICN